MAVRLYARRAERQRFGAYCGGFLAGARVLKTTTRRARHGLRGPKRAGPNGNQGGQIPFQSGSGRWLWLAARGAGPRLAILKGLDPNWGGRIGPSKGGTGQEGQRGPFRARLGRAAGGPHARSRLRCRSTSMAWKPRQGGLGWRCPIPEPPAAHKRPDGRIELIAQGRPRQKGMDGRQEENMRISGE